ncbi:hypothetical protein TRIUR3_32727 [Triticum urartu]|uniref:Uncharacterized protein n=1 Tax=Triticum urartu TaxID=4572 RepID=M8AUV7_TRIUA|nr:hypothetical protein TRIUR3_32727 [Triticum urartu]
MAAALVNDEFGGDLREQHSDLASVHSTQSTLASADSFTMAAALVRERKRM